LGGFPDPPSQSGRHQTLAQQICRSGEWAARSRAREEERLLDWEGLDSFCGGGEFVLVAAFRDELEW